jgi:hypothetical protein
MLFRQIYKLTKRFFKKIEHKEKIVKNDYHYRIKQLKKIKDKIQCYIAADATGFTYGDIYKQNRFYQRTTFYS